MNEVQTKALDYYRECISRGGFVPTQAEVAAKLDVSVARVNRVVGQLEERGYIRRVPGRPRAIELAGRPSLIGVPSDELRAELARRGITLEALNTGERPVMRRGVMTCAADTCRVPVEQGKLFCRRHWHSLPEELKQGIWFAFIGNNVARYERLLTAARDHIDRGLYPPVLVRNQ